MDREALVRQIKVACGDGIHLLPSSILCESIGTAVMRDGIVISPDTPLSECLMLLREHKIGSLLVAGEAGTLEGIFTERDWILKVGGDVRDLNSAPVSGYMTRDPVRERSDSTIAFALNLMSHGGFRHLPIVDEQDMPVGVVSVKDVIDLIVERMMTGLIDSCGIG